MARKKSELKTSSPSVLRSEGSFIESDYSECYYQKTDINNEVSSRGDTSIPDEDSTPGVITETQLETRNILVIYLKKELSFFNIY